MTMYDTNIMVDYLRGKEGAKELIEKSRDERGVAISAISAYELLDGVKANEEESLETLFERVKIYAMDLKSARIAGELHMKLKKEGSELSVADMFIIATAKANDETFVTQDSGFKGAYDKIVVLKG